MDKRGLLIGGRWVSGQDEINVLDKYSGEVIGIVAEAGEDDVKAAVQAARKAQPIISNLPAHQRSAILEKCSLLIEQNKEQLAEIIAREAGKAWKYSLGEVERAVQTFKFAAEVAKDIHGETVPMDAAKGSESKLGFYLRFPVGVIAAISPFNFPLNLVAHKVAPAIAAGNSIVLKPATATPLTALYLGELLQQAGLPDGALNIVIGKGSTVGHWLITHPEVDMVTFTGSPPVGKYIMARGGLKKYTMELGSNSAVIICEDASLDEAIPKCVIGSFANSGQICISIQRIYVHDSVFQEFTEKFLELTRRQVVGNPLDKDCDVGPMIDINEAKRVEQWVNEAVEQGARILIGGKRERAIYYPTVITDADQEMKIVKNEVFGPIVTLFPFSSFQEAINQVDNSKYGLQTGIYTRDLNKAFQVVKQVNVGGVMINEIPTFRADHMPYGGNKESGIGREGLKYAVEEMTNIKMVCINL